MSERFFTMGLLSVLR